MLIKEAKLLAKITGGLSKPSKMPGPAYNLPAAGMYHRRQVGQDTWQRLRWLLCIEGPLQVQECPGRATA
jgi:hypothetical protein